MDKMKVDQDWIDIEIIKRKRKTVEIQIKSGHLVRVLIPEKLSKRKLEAILADRQGWIEEKIRLLRSVPNIQPTKTPMAFNQPITVFGEELFLVFEKVPSKASQKGFEFLKQNELLICVGGYLPDQETIRKSLEQYFRREAKIYIDNNLGKYTKVLGVHVNQVRVKEQKRRWGSCSSLKNLNFNWRCAQMPPWVFDYIIAHEVCHLVHMNHSRDFWTLLSELYPETLAARQWLKVHGRFLLD